MKSIIQEASSIAKAIELGWIKAKKPEHFSIKILEPKHNGYEIGHLFTSKSDAEANIYLDEYEQYFLNFAKNFHGEMARGEEAKIEC